MTSKLIFLIALLSGLVYPQDSVALKVRTASISLNLHDRAILGIYEAGYDASGNNLYVRLLQEIPLNQPGGSFDRKEMIHLGRTLINFAGPRRRHHLKKGN